TGSASGTTGVGRGGRGSPLPLLAFLRDQPLDQFDQLVKAASRLAVHAVLAADDDRRRTDYPIGLDVVVGRTDPRVDGEGFRRCDEILGLDTRMAAIEPGRVLDR